MIQTITFSAFCDAFRHAGRADQFSYEGKRIIFDYLEEYEESTGTQIELDVIALCCEYYEMSWQEIASEYRIDLSECDDDEEKEQAVIEYVNNHSIVLGSSINGIVYAAF